MSYITIIPNINIHVKEGTTWLGSAYLVNEWGDTLRGHRFRELQQHEDRQLELRQGRGLLLLLLGEQWGLFMSMVIAQRCCHKWRGKWGE